MAKEVLSVDFTWLPDEKQLDELRNKSKDTEKRETDIKQREAIVFFRRYISKLLGVTVTVKEARLVTNVSYQNDADEEEDEVTVKKNISTVLGYLESLYTLSCKLSIESSSDNYKLNLIHLLCSRKYIKESPEFWAAFSDLNFLTGELQLESFEAFSLIIVQEFGLGNLVGLNTFVQHFDSSSSLSKSANYKITQVKVKFSYENFEVYFMVGDNSVPVAKRSIETHQLFKMIFNYSTFHRLLICDVSKGTFTLYLHFLKNPILYTARHKKFDKSEEDNKKYISYETMDDSVEWFREVNLHKNCRPELKYEFSMNTVLQLKLKKSEYISINHLIHQFCKQLTPLFTSMRVLPYSTNNMQINSLSSDHFRCFYALKCLLTKSNEFIDQITTENGFKEVNAFFTEKKSKRPDILADVLTHIYNQMDQGCVIMFTSTIKTLYEKLEDAKLPDSPEKEEKKIVYIKKAVLTPTHVVFHPPHPQLYNRILRNSKGHLLRVSIRDCNMSLINHNLKGYGPSSSDYKTNFLKKNFKVLERGIKLGNRLYEYLGMSSSQLRSHSVWCYAKGLDNKTIDEVRKAIGDLDQIYEVPKFMARLGQSFSQAVGRIQVPQELTNIDDPEKTLCEVTGEQKAYMSDDEDISDEKKSDLKIKSMSGKLLDCNGKEFDCDIGKEEPEDEKDPYIFSDGIGKMSQEIANKIYTTLNLEEEKPSGVQIRYAGCKGMLVVDPLMTDAEQIMFRKSMKKYESKDDSLEILKISKPRRVYLNRPFITILEAKGIDKEVFLKLQKQMIHGLIKSMFYDEDAMKVLNENSELRLIDYEMLYKVGIGFTEDPLFRSMILAIFKNKISLLKTKSRIALPDAYARNMFGVLDETKELEYGEVFVQYSDFNSSETKILEGPVVVSKSPMLHIGDVRRFQAVKIEGLKHVKDCIVFPAKGSRPHPDEMAGSDLDGDEYVVTWYEDLIFEDNSPPMKYSIKKKKKLTSSGALRPIGTIEQLNHFFNYILNDTVGQLANAHLARADRDEKGVRSDVCVKIAKKHAKAVDFAKTGQIAVMDHKERTKIYPDFMEKIQTRRLQTYVSRHALGYLFRNCKNLEIGLAATADKMEFQLDADLQHPDWERYEKTAKKTYQQYCKKINFCLKAYGMGNEGEFLSGNILGSSMANEEFRNMLELLEHEVKWLFKRFEKEFFDEFGGKPSDPRNYTEDMLIKASAWYMTSYTGSIFGSTRFYGLPWVVSSVLTILKIKKRKILDIESNIFVKKASFVEEAIDNALAKHMQYENKMDDEDLMSSKLYVLDTSRTVLDKWLNLQRQNFINDNIDRIAKCIDDEFSAVSQTLLCCDDDHLKELMVVGNKALSPGHYVLETLMQISDMGTGHADLEVTFDTAFQEFGLCAWITLIKLACSCNPEYLGIIGDVDSERLSHLATDDTICKMFVVNFYTDEAQEKFRMEEEVIRLFFMEKFKIQDVALHPDKHEKRNLFIRVFVRGSRYSIDRLQDAIVRGSHCSRHHKQDENVEEDFLTQLVNFQPVFKKFHGHVHKWKESDSYEE